MLRQYGYEATRQVGSHVRLQSSLRGFTHQVTVPTHQGLKLGTLSAILSDVADYLQMEREKLAMELFEK